MTAHAIRVLEGHARTYRHTWKASLVSSFLNPLLFLLAMGIGLGTLVDDGTPGLQGVSYLDFLAPGLLAATAMQTGAGDSSWPVMGGIKWMKTYHAALATPIGPADLVHGHLAWVSLRLLLTSGVFALVMTLFGVGSPLPVALAVLPAVLTGLAVAAPVMAYAAGLDNDYGLASMFRFGIVPMFLFSGTFFPVSQLPEWLRPVAYATPLWHGVELARATALGVATAAPVAMHVTFLVALFLAGAVVARRRFRARLVT